MRSRTRLALAAGLTLTGLAFAPVTNAQLFDEQRQHLNKMDAANSVIAADHAVATGATVASGLDGVVTDLACEGGSAGPYACDGIDLVSFVPLASFASQDGTDVEASDIWGWTDPETGDEIVLLGTTAGTAVFRVTDATNPEYLGRVENPGTTRRVWQDIKVADDHAYIVSESTHHGMLVLDLTALRDLDGTTDTTLQIAPTARYHPYPYIDSHNLVINEAQQMAYLVGSDQAETFESDRDLPVNLGLGINRQTTYGDDECVGGLHAVDISDPTAPVFVGCWAGDEYIHDAQCTRYTGGDAEHVGKDICLGANEDTVSVVDMTDPTAPVLLSRTTYDGARYVHQGWLTEDQDFLLLGDELDERGSNATTTMIFDVRDLDAISLVNKYAHDSVVIDHNLYTMDGLAYMSNYEAGLRITDLDDVAAGQLTEVAFFDTYPESDNAAFNGTWSNYPYFDSGTVAVSGIGEGLYLLRVQDEVLTQHAD